MKKKACIVIVGPTAAGKSLLGIGLAKEFMTEIISADSRQCFRELNIGVAKPSIEQLQLIKHYFIDSHSIHDEVNAAVFERYALSAAHEIFQKHDICLMVGGTGLYIKAFCEGLDEIPAISSTIREGVRSGYEKFGLEWLLQQVETNDPDYFIHGEKLNPQRLMRSLEIKLSTGQPITSFQSQNKKKRDFEIIKIGFQLPREELYHKINHRVDEMIQNGLVEEARDLLASRHINALNSVGYKELFDYFDGHISIDEAIDAIKKNTRHYAKRQLTWFKKDEFVKWFSPSEFPAVKQYCIDMLAP